ncbi:aspartate aminotransferase family protein [Virgibacillus profundi]|uniref:Acetylornithine aminotransferase n=1 Tax=Virgibacillus profundi TaxID=2024555 RepID=A0A2A2ICQ5_9BACI|nr:acetylornithine transaminase [Virgibacillus profundi]PAV29791.1 aspartate aminotransferase family protein [Virgibacillus profundi]PXY53963.1 acetylornithine transaminase [Virgibacillus profundi]
MSSTVEKQSKLSVMNTYQRFPITLVKGKGSYVWDDSDKQFLDYTSGIATCNLGHVPTAVQTKLKEQIDTLWHCSNLYNIPSQQALADELTKNSCFDKVFFCNSGAEANEAAIKIAKKYAKDKGYDERTEIITFNSSFHGRTGTTMAATAQEKIHQGFTPITPGFRYLPFNDTASLNQLYRGKTAAVLLELVQGEGGVNPASQDWIKKLQEICEKEDILLMIDEIQTGIGRTGTLFAYEQFDIEPDVITLAKGLGSGFPIGAMLAKEAVADSFQPGTHGSTFGGNPLAMSAGLATIEAIEAEGILSEVKIKGEWLKAELEELKTAFSSIEEVRGVGLLLGVQLSIEVSLFIDAFRENGILVLAAGGNVLRIVPPLTTTKKELKSFIHTFKLILAEIERTSL